MRSVDSVVVYSLFVVGSIVCRGFDARSLFCGLICNVLSSSATILLRKRESCLLCINSVCGETVGVLCLFLAVLWIVGGM